MSEREHRPDSRRRPGGELYILSAPSGAGKTTVIRPLLRSVPELHFVVSYTTRLPRAGERDGSDYRFVDRPSFERMVDEGRFLEWAVVHGNCYGTGLADVLAALSRGEDVLLEIDVQGAERVLARHAAEPGLLGTGLHTIFLMPPSYEVLRGRLLQRGLDDEATIERRLAAAQAEMERARGYDYVIFNEDAEAASRILASIILEKRHQRPRMAARLQAALQGFERRREPAATDEAASG